MKRITKWVMMGITAFALSTQASTIIWTISEETVDWWNTEHLQSVTVPPFLFFLIWDGYEDIIVDALFNETFYDHSMADMGIIKEWARAPGAFVFGEPFDATISDAGLGPFAVRMLLITGMDEDFMGSIGESDKNAQFAISGKIDAFDGVPFIVEDPSISYTMGSWYQVEFINFTPIPEPLTTGLALAGVALLIAQRRRKS